MTRLFCFWFLLMGTVGLAQDLKPTPTPLATETPVVQEPSSPDTIAQQELRLLKQHMEDAMNAHDIELLMEGVVDDIVFTTADGQAIKGHSNLRTYFEKQLKGPNPPVRSFQTEIQLDEMTILYADETGVPKYGVAYGSSKDNYLLEDGTSMSVTPRWSAALVRDEQSWKIANFHYSVNFFDNPVLTKTKGLNLLYSGGGLIIGLLMGFLVGRRRK